MFMIATASRLWLWKMVLAQPTPWRRTAVFTPHIEWNICVGIEQMGEAIWDGVDLRGYIIWGLIGLVSASTGEMATR